MQKKILYIINHMDWFWSHRLDLARAAQDAEYQVMIAAPGAADDLKLTEYGFTGVNINRIYGPYCVWRLMRRVRRIVQEHHIDIVHAITLKYAFPVGLSLRNHKDVRVVHTIAGLGYLFSGTGWKPKLLRAFITPFFRRAFITSHTKIIFQNPDDLDLMCKRGFAARDQAVLILGSGVHMEVFKSIPEPESDMPLVLFPTRLVWSKGIRIFIEAAKICARQNIVARFAIAGGVRDNTPEALSEVDMREALSGSNVEWFGHVSDMPALLSSAAVIAYPSWYGEGIPKVLLEAAACGRPIITTDHPGCREVIDRGQNGILVSVQDSQGLATAMHELMRDPAQRFEMGLASRKFAHQKFDVAKIIAQTLEVYAVALETVRDANTNNNRI